MVGLWAAVVRGRLLPARCTPPQTFLLCWLPRRAVRDVGVLTAEMGRAGVIGAVPFRLNPSAALVKAMLVASAEPMRGIADGTG